MRGATRLEAARAAGSKALEPSALAWARRVEASALYRQITSTAAMDREQLLGEAWDAALRFAFEILTGSKEATNFDRLKAMELVGKARGEFIQRQEVKHTHVLPFRSLVRDEVILPGRVVEASALPAGDEAGKDEGNDSSE